MNDLIKEELETIRKSNNGFLRPQDVVEYARDPNSALHTRFTWDDSEAAEKYRLAEARALIRVSVVVEANTSEKLRAYVSLTSDRNELGGYRAIAEVINDEVLIDRLLDDALKELEIFKRKYERLKSVSALGGVFSAIEDVTHNESQVA